ncbi:CoA-binding protein [Chengkuizengella axinellae]|uniref:CoA-binding protein n=1 Tax=Chengkuizengella axinellae TaxID=3064388 RepID=A0ABT9IVL4_9BACL|nr:CoA-binding protein [Chengkuizengella sp. 2205SS18-9]MDP5273313.1 CoA-binding protein [Chengkuizengella sp. 2205SS18-9]
MMHENPSRDQIKEILRQTETIAVVGLSDKPDRTSHMVSAAMQQKGYRIIPVNPNADEILGEKSYPTLKDIPEPVDIVNVFRRSEYTPPIAKEAVDIGAKVFWLQLGIVSEEAAQIVIDGGLKAIMDRCIKVEDSILNPKE